MNAPSPFSAADASTAADPARRLAGLRILVAEDHPANRETCLLALKDLGCQADWVENGAEVLEIVGRRSYDVVLMDCLMPGLDGFRAAAEIRAHEQAGLSTHRTLIVALTGHTENGTEERSRAAGMDVFMTKPYTPGQLRDAILQALERE